MSQRLYQLSTTCYTDTLFSTQKLIIGNTCAQMFTDGKGFTYVHPMKSKTQNGEALHKVTIDVGVPNSLISDRAIEQTSDNTYIKDVIKRCHIDIRMIEPYSPWQTQDENTIGIIKAKSNRRRIRWKILKRCWGFRIVWEAEIYCRTAGKDGRTAMERITGDTQDISEWLEFEFYDLCWFWDNQQDSSEPKLGRWLGVSHRVGSALFYWILSNIGNVLARTTVQNIIKLEAANLDVQQSIRDYHVSMNKEIESDKFITDLDGMTNFINNDVDVDISEEDDILNWLEEKYQGLPKIPKIPEIDEVVDNSDRRKQADIYYQFLGAKLVIPDSSGMTAMARVIKRIKDNDGNGMSTVTPNTLTNTSLYEVEFPDGHVEELQYNIIAENMMSQVDSEGDHYQLLAEISDHQSNNLAITKKNGFILSKSGNLHTKKTRMGWSIEV